MRRAGPAGRMGRRRRTLPPRLRGSTIRAARLNDRVRDGNGCGPRAIAAGTSLIFWRISSVGVLATPCGVHEYASVVAAAPPFDLHQNLCAGGAWVWATCGALAALRRRAAGLSTFAPAKTTGRGLIGSCGSTAILGGGQKLERSDQAARAISTARLSMSPCLHLPPINVLVSHGPSGGLRPRECSSRGELPA